MNQPLRNIAIIAHVDHGKTTLVDAMLGQARVFREGQVVQERVMDSDELERERGITILSKNTSLVWQGVRINIVDTPGHADFGGEVERVLSMADGALLLVDAFEGAMPQTRFVLRKAFAAGLRPIVVINKMDRPDARPREVYDEVFGLFIDLDADEVALECPVVYASSRDGWASLRPDERGADLTPLLDTIVARVPAPEDRPEDPLCFRVSTIDWSDFVGRIAVGRVHAGALAVGDRVAHVGADGRRRAAEIRGLYRFEGLGRQECRRVEAGDIAALYGIDEIFIGDGLVDLERGTPLPPIAVDPPTVAMAFKVNDSPLAGREGRYVTSRNIKDRLQRELRTNLALRVEPTGSADTVIVKGRGVLHLGILVERMRREGYEFAVARPRVITRREGGRLLEPIEHLVVDCPEAVSGKVMELAGARKGEMLRMDNRGAFLHLEFTIPARGLVGFRTRLLNSTCGEAVMHHTFYEYGEHRGAIPERTAGAMVAHTAGAVTGYALEQLRGRGTFFVQPGDPCYTGMVVGEHCREEDVLVNAARQKKLNNIRSSTKEITEKLPPPRIMGVEEALEYVGDDELVEITPSSLRLRKALLDPKARKRVRSVV
jgi:GTP-binding protein